MRKPQAVMKVKERRMFEFIFVLLFIIFFGLAFSGVFIKVDDRHWVRNMVQLLALVLIFFQIFYAIKSLFVYKGANRNYLMKRLGFIAIAVALFTIGTLIK